MNGAPWRSVEVFMNQSLLVLSFGLALVMPGPALMAQTSLAGHWEGNVVLPDKEMAITVDLTKSDKGEWTGSFGVPPQGVSGLKIDKLEVDGKNVKFSVPEAPGVPEFSGTLKDDGHLALNLSVGGGSFPADMKRTGEAKVETRPPSPAVDKKFEGDWDGSLDTPGGSLHLVLHVQNQPDKTVKVTMDSPDQGALGMGMSEIVQKDASIEMKLKLVNGSFKGTLNAEGTELTGEWTQNGGTLPLKLKKVAK
jgi:hypothetical protein